MNLKLTKYWHLSENHLISKDICNFSARNKDSFGSSIKTCRIARKK